MTSAVCGRSASTHRRPNVVQWPLKPNAVESMKMLWRNSNCGYFSSLNWAEELWTGDLQRNSINRINIIYLFLFKVQDKPVSIRKLSFPLENEHYS